ncbi:pig-T [Schizosaccharomyces japonicus yFS275]|uniref:Pig-T n=1 Tax=Schizosaccharomyces japonicus (strain yFS275 / FY16936) TaxID=402676 RepID=B6JWR9_SCHJY|nr:pig-T [Schizosaccharomyces japonicus yFS275]EEB05820.1 pig-T [Schizosaccharomyces japonicus yFS275]
MKFFAALLLCVRVCWGFVRENYGELLTVKPLTSKHVLSTFEFTIDVNDLHDSSTDDFFDPGYTIVPLQIARLIKENQVAEMHLRFTRGRWDVELWGEIPKQGLSSGGTGLELWSYMPVERDNLHWYQLTNQLSGIFCASLDTIDSTNTYQPRLPLQAKVSQPNHAFYFAALPQESVCTENLTPFLKLLPCKTKSGIASLINQHLLFDTNWHSLSLDILPSNEGERTDGANVITSTQIVITIQAVHDVERRLRRPDKSVFYPPEEECEHYDDNGDRDGEHGKDPLTCLKAIRSPFAVHFYDFFGMPPKPSCPLSTNEHDVLVVGADKQSEAWYRLSDGRLQDDVVFTTLQQRHPDLVRADYALTNYGNHWSGISLMLTNPQPKNYTATAMSQLPWFAHSYLHTLQVRVNDTLLPKEDVLCQIAYRPFKDRVHNSFLELQFLLPAFTSVKIITDFEKSPIKLHEYPPDANRGFDIPPAIISIYDNTTLHSTLRTTSLLLSLPTPDFSMPYNVIILTSTVMALTFGSIFNLLVRRFVPLTHDKT